MDLGTTSTMSQRDVHNAPKFPCLTEQIRLPSF